MTDIDNTPNVSTGSNTVLSECAFFIRTNDNKKIKVVGKIITLPSGEKIGAYQTGRRDSLSNKPYTPCWSITCLKTGWSLSTTKELKIDWVHSIADLICDKASYKYLLKKYKGDYCNDLRHFR